MVLLMYNKGEFRIFLPSTGFSERITMGKIVYDKLLKLLDQKGLTTYKIRKEKIISESTLQNIREGKRITTDSIAALCAALNCQPGDILEYVPEKEHNEEI